MKKLLVVLLLAGFGSGCYTMKTVAPAGSQVSALSENAPVEFVQKKKVWFALWGLVPVSENNAAQIIRDNDLRSVRVTTKIAFVDYVIALFTGIASFVPATMIIEGNVGPANAADAGAAADLQAELPVAQPASPAGEPDPMR